MISREGNKHFSFFVVQFIGRAQSHLPELGLVFWIPILDPFGKLQGSNRLRTYVQVHVDESSEYCRIGLSELALLADETPQSRLASSQVLGRKRHLIRHSGEHGKSIRMVP